MSKVWKWIIGILIVLVVAAVVVGGVVMVRNRTFMASRVRPMTFGTGQTRPNFQGTPVAPGAPNAQGTPNVPAAPNGQNRPTMPYGYNGQNRPMMPYGYNGQNRPMMPYGYNGQNRPMTPYGFNGQNHPMGGWSGRGPMMERGSHFGMLGMGFIFLGGMLFSIVPLVILALVAFLFYQLGKRAGINSVKNQSPSSSEPAPVETTGRGRRVAKS
jgi:hypothetical protein